MNHYIVLSIEDSEDKYICNFYLTVLSITLEVNHSIKIMGSEIKGNGKERKRANLREILKGKSKYEAVTYRNSSLCSQFCCLTPLCFQHYFSELKGYQFLRELWPPS